MAKARHSGGALSAASIEDTHALEALTIANRLRPVLLRIHRHMRGEAHELGMTTMRGSILTGVALSPGIGLGELARREHVTPPTLVSHIDKLEEAGLVERRRDDASDRRRVSITITEAGTHVLDMLRERRTAWLATRLSTLSPEALAAIEAAVEPLQQLVRTEGAAR